MNTSEPAEMVAVGAADVELRALGEGRFELLTGARKFVLRITDEQEKALSEIVTDILPKLFRTVPVREQVTAAEIELLAPYVKQLASMGVLLFPRQSIETVADLRLYSFIARRTAEADKVFGSVKAKRVTLTGPDRLTTVFAGPLRDQGLTVDGAGAHPRTETDTDAALTVAVSLGDEAGLDAINRRLCGEGRSWLPVLVTPGQLRLGPWTMPGESACPRCYGPPRPVADDLPATGSWLTLQPGFLGWAGGVLAHMTMRGFVPMGAEHPWGRITTIDAARCEQTSVRAWRDPYCAVCAPHAPARQEWAEV
ncbi:hypothetical protein [Streptomyces niveus]|uniref:hypothetical protein n=1 Tax=Streptomyces niveus TaxID=193462 RepID=UPI00114CB7A1|nr:hypothetical protein [Streptomyces niveus]